MKDIKRHLYSLVLIIWDIISVFIALMSACMLSDNKSIFAYFDSYTINPWLFFIAFTLIFITFNYVFRCYGVVLRHFGVTDLIHQGLSIFFSAAGFVAFNYIYPVFYERYLTNAGWIYSDNLRKKVLFLMVLILAFLSVFGRSLIKFITTATHFITSADPNSKRVLIFGAGEAGVYLQGKLENDHNLGMHAVVFVDDDPNLIGRRIRGTKVVGNRDVLAESIIKHKIDTVIIAIPTATKELIKFVLQVCQSTNCSVQRFGEINDSDLDKVHLTNINYEDLLHRSSVSLDMEKVVNFVKGKTVMVTGGAGSIGSEICRQVLSFGCEKLIVFDIHENGLFFIDNELKERFDNSRFVMRLGSIQDRNRLNEVFDEFQPQIVFHAAAHKHVPMMEINPKEAVKNNVFGSYNLALAAIAHNVEKFVSISTDKAVNPTNIMGATKRIVELIIQKMDRDSDTEFVAVRFGNVLGSNGSVVPFFRQQIAEGGPVTVTDPEMRRYFMTIPEAVQLVLEAGAMAKGGEIFVLDMGEPVKIYDLACDLIRLSGYRPNVDIPIVFTGLRPGEKLFEELRIDGESCDKTENNKIFRLKPIDENNEHFVDQLLDLGKSVHGEDSIDVFELVHNIVPTFDHKTMDE